MKHHRVIIYLAGFLFSMAIALVSYINSSFLENYVGKNYVGIIYIIASIATILALLKMPKVLNRLGNRSTILLSFVLAFLSLVALALGNNIFIVIPAFILYFASIGLIIASLDIFLEDFSKRTSIGSSRGFYLMIVNSAWIISQIISGSIITKVSFLGIYLLSSGFIFLLLLFFFFSLRDFKDPEYRKVSILKTIKTFKTNKHVSRIYSSNLILQFFYAWMVIYTPIYLHENIGFGWDKIGIIFSIMLIPFVLLDFPLGKLSDKIGEKNMLIFGYFIIFFSVIIIPFITKPELWIWALVLFATRIGAATIETMNESYFFKVVTEKDADEITFFRNASSVAYVIAPIIALPLLFLMASFSHLFFVLSAILLLGFLIALKLEDVK